MTETTAVEYDTTIQHLSHVFLEELSRNGYNLRYITPPRLEAAQIIQELEHHSSDPSLDDDSTSTDTQKVLQNQKNTTRVI